MKEIWHRPLLTKSDLKEMGKGKACYEKRFPNAKGYEGGYYAVSDSDGNWGFADEAGENVIPCQYVDAYSFSNQTAAVQYAGKWGYINQYGNMVINAEYSEALATVYKGNIIKNLIMDCQSYTKYRPNETTGGIFVSWRRKEDLSAVSPSPVVSTLYAFSTRSHLLSRSIA